VGLYFSVIAAANVVEAWELLENPNHRFDLVLLDVVVPSSSLSGVSLLLKIMEHHSFKQIPVVMTSKHDSMDIVYQCLSKGAADFLVKPMRKNELKNLWQHVWRKNCNRVRVVSSARSSPFRKSLS
jgi:pseudo-response regulator 7